MKFLCTLILLLASCDGNAPDPPPVTETTTFAFSVEGMHCEACTHAISSSVEQIEGVVDCSVSLEEKQAVVHVVDPSLRDTILEAIRKLQFTVEPIAQ